MASHLDQAACKGKCGKEVFNRSGYCKECRKYTCKSCGKQDAWKDFPKDLCTRCDDKKKNQFYKHINQWG